MVILDPCANSGKNLSDMVMLSLCTILKSPTVVGHNNVRSMCHIDIIGLQLYVEMLDPCSKWKLMAASGHGNVSSVHHAKTTTQFSLRLQQSSNHFQRIVLVFIQLGPRQR